MITTTATSLRDTILDKIGSFLYEEGYSNQPYIADGIVEVINLIADYQEEGKSLFPEVLITNNINILNTVTDFKIPIGSLELSIESFKKVMKYCAPLCSGEWAIFVEVKEGTLNYGMICAEITETTPSLYHQTVGEMKLDIPECNVAYIRNIGKKTVELKGLRNEVIVSLSLDNLEDISSNLIQSLAAKICSEVEDSIRLISTSFLEKALNDGFKEGHGNLIGVISSSGDAIEQLLKKIPSGVYLPEPINLVDLVRTFNEDPSGINSVALRQFTMIVANMCNNDGIAVFNTSGNLLGYHLIMGQDFIPPEESNSSTGGARTRAFHNMEHSKLFEFGFVKSQDGPMKIFENL